MFCSIWPPDFQECLDTGVIVLSTQVAQAFYAVGYANFKYHPQSCFDSPSTFLNCMYSRSSRRYDAIL